MNETPPFLQGDQREPHDSGKEVDVEALNKIGVLYYRISDLDGVKKAIDWYAQHGYPQIKIYNSFRPEWVSAATQYAHERGLRVSGHVPAFMRAEDVVRHPLVERIVRAYDADAAKSAGRAP